MTRTFFTHANQVLEFVFKSGKEISDPFNQIELDVIFSSSKGEMKVPAFWSGGDEWRVRFSSSDPGNYSYRSVCSDSSAEGLHNQLGIVEVKPTDSKNPLYLHGGIRVQADRGGFEHKDGTPFFWLADTWWMAFCGRIRWPEEINQLLTDRVKKGFTVAHLVSGLFPDMPPFDPRGANEAGWAWEENFTRINPAFYDLADLKLQAVVSHGIVPLIVGAWGYYLPFMGIEKMKKHWRYLVARWGAYPVSWCLAGEVTMPWYLSNTKDSDFQFQKTGWSEVGWYLKTIDPFNRTITAHSASTGESPTELDDPSYLDYNFIQTGHGNQSASLGSARHFMRVEQTTTLKPIVTSESNYEGILGAAWQDVIRYIFWSTMLAGGVGFSYGANGIWQLNEREIPYGPSPHGMSWGNIPWQEAMNLPGSTQVGLGKKLLTRYRWWKFQTHPEWITPHATLDDPYQPYSAGIPGEVRIIYSPYPLAPWLPEMPKINGLEKEVNYQAFFFDPATGTEQQIGKVNPDETGNWTIPMPSLGQDIILVLEAV